MNVGIKHIKRGIWKRKKLGMMWLKSLIYGRNMMIILKN
jgi:hypothetical protein